MKQGLLLLCWMFCIPAIAQIVNIENKRFDNDTSRWSANAGFRYNLVENTQRSIDLGAHGGLQFINGIHRAFFITDLNINRVEANAFTNTGFQHLRYQRAWRGMFSWEGYTQLQYNKPLRIDVQWMMGGGLRAVVRSTNDMRLALGTSVLYEHEVDRENALRYDDVRSSNYIAAAFKVEPYMQVTTILYYQPRLADASDQRVALEAQLRIRATRCFAFDTRINLQKDTKTAPGVPILSYRWSNLFTFLM